MLKEYNSILLFGPPGSGKGTQGAILNSIPGVFHCSIGEVLRHLDMNSELGRLFIRYSSAGQLLPTDITIRIWANYIQDSVKKRQFSPQNDLLILDGIPRTIEQATKIENHINVLKVIHLKCDNKNALIQRLHHRAKTDNREDDLKDTIIQHRIDVYENETYPVLDTYKGKVVDIDGLQPPINVLYEIIGVLKSVVKNKS